MQSFRRLTPRFSLRAILVAMFLMAIFFAYHVSWIRQRRAEFLASEGYRPLAEGESGIVIDESSPDAALWMAAAESKLPIGLKLCGERAYSDIVRRWDDEATWKGEETRLRTIFPEAVIWRFSK